MECYLPAQWPHLRSPLGVILVVSLLLHILLVASLDLPRYRFTPIEHLFKDALQVTIAPPRPTPPAITTEPQRPTTTSHHEAPEESTQTEPSPHQLSADFYRSMENGEYARRIVTRQQVEQELVGRFAAPVKPRSKKTTGKQWAKGKSIREDRFPDGSLRVTLIDRHGRKRCFEAQPDDRLNEFDYGGWFVPVVIGC